MSNSDKYRVYVLCRRGCVFNRFWIEGEGSKSRTTININRAYKFSDMYLAEQIIQLNDLDDFRVFEFDMMKYTMREVK